MAHSGGKGATKSKSNKIAKPGKHGKVFEEDEGAETSPPPHPSKATRGEKTNGSHARH